MPKNQPTPPPRLILASSSPYRKAQLEQLRLDFEAISPNIVESMQANETPESLSVRLAKEKARVVAKENKDAIVVGGDQTASFAGQLLTKPGTKERAAMQLRACSGNVVTFFSSVCLLNAATNRFQIACIPTRVTFRPLSKSHIDTYIEAENPIDCVGSFKCEGLGITLFERFESDDPTALVGIPLLTLNKMLMEEELDPLHLLDYKNKMLPHT